MASAAVGDSYSAAVGLLPSMLLGRSARISPSSSRWQLMYGFTKGFLPDMMSSTSMNVLEDFAESKILVYLV